jgi:hypothetical protein
MPVAIAARGMLSNSASSGSCAMVRPPRSLIRFRPMAPSPSGARQDDRGRARPVRVGQGAEEEVDGDAAPRLGRQVGAMQVPVRGLDRLARRDHVDVVGLDAGAFADPRHRHGRRPAQDLGERALVVRSEMDHDNERHAASRRHGGEKGLQGGDRAGRAAQPDHRQHVVRARRHDVVDQRRGLLLGMVRRGLDARLVAVAQRNGLGAARSRVGSLLHGARMGL